MAMPRFTEPSTDIRRPGWYGREAFELVNELRMVVELRRLIAELNDLRHSKDS